MAPPVQFQINQAAVRALLTNPRGEIGRDMLRRGRNVAFYARRFAPVRTGRLRASIDARLIPYAGGVACTVSTRVPYAYYQHEGTGIYGPHGTPIVPVTAKFLRFIPKGGSTYVFAKEVRGTPPTFFLTRALAAGARV